MFAWSGVENMSQTFQLLLNAISSMSSLKGCLNRSPKGLKDLQKECCINAPAFLNRHTEIKKAEDWSPSNTNLCLIGRRILGRWIWRLGFSLQRLRCAVHRNSSRRYRREWSRSCRPPPRPARSPWTPPAAFCSSASALAAPNRSGSGFRFERARPDAPWEFRWESVRSGRPCRMPRRRCDRSRSVAAVVPAGRHRCDRWSCYWPARSHWYRCWCWCRYCGGCWPLSSMMRCCWSWCCCWWWRRWARCAPLGGCWPSWGGDSPRRDGPGAPGSASDAAGCEGCWAHRWCARPVEWPGMLSVWTLLGLILFDCSSSDCLLVAWL